MGKSRFLQIHGGLMSANRVLGSQLSAFPFSALPTAVPTLIKEVINELCPSRWLYYLYPADKYNYKAEVIKRNPVPGVTQFCVYSSVRERKRLNPVFQSQTGALPLRGQARPLSEVPAVFSWMLLPRAVNQKLAACLDNASRPRMRQLPGNPGISSGWAGMSCSLSSLGAGGATGVSSNPCTSHVRRGRS